MKVLILDDDILDLEGMKLLIDWKAHLVDEVFCATSIKAACDIAEHESVDIALCDIELPEGSGLDFVNWLNEQDSKTVVIMVTSHARFDYASRALQLHARDYLLKPVSPDVLEKSLDQAIAYRKYLLGNRTEPDDSGTFAEEENEVVARVKNYIREHLSEQITRNEIAGEIYLHPDYLSHIFKDNMHMTLSEYIFQERIKKAKQLLEGRAFSVTQIGMEVGFSNTSYFDKIFRKYEGCRPKDYRARYYKEHGII